MGLRELFRSTFGARPLETYSEGIPVVDEAGRPISLLDWPEGGSAYADYLPALQRGRQMTADTIRSMPAVAYRQGIRLGEQPPIVRRPDPSSDALTFKSETVLSLIDHGNSLWWITFDDRRNQAIAAEVVPWSKVEVRADTYGRRAYRIDNRDVPRRQIRHLAMNRGAGQLIGKGPFQSSRLRGLVSMQQYAAQYFSEASNPSGILVDPFENDADEADEKLDAWNDISDRGTRFLSGGVKFIPNTMTPGESAWVESHAAGYVDVAVLLGIPVPLLGASLLGGASSIVYQNLTNVYEQWFRDTLSVTYIPLIETAWSSIVPLGTHVELDPDALLKPDLAGRTDHAIAAFEAGVITVDEARAQIGYDDASPGPLPTAPQKPNQEIAS